MKEVWRMYFKNQKTIKRRSKKKKKKPENTEERNYILK